MVHPGERTTFKAGVFIDATFEGDVASLACSTTMKCPPASAMKLRRGASPRTCSPTTTIARTIVTCGRAAGLGANTALQTIRMEPAFMALGEACGMAAVNAQAARTQVRNVNVTEVQREIVKRGGVILYEAQPLVPESLRP